MENWQYRPLDDYDDHKPIYTPLRISKKLKVIELAIEIEQYSWYKRLFYYLFERRRFVKSRKRSEWIVQYLFTRSLLYASSVEFQEAMKVPADFHIEHSLVNIQTWMMIDRLRKIGTAESKFTGKFMELMIKKWMEQEVSRIHLRKKNEFVRDIESYMRVSNGYLDYHFNRNPATVKNNYYKLDALVWSIVYFEKVPRYSDEVFKMADYLKATYDYIQTLPFQKFEDCDVQFDVLKVALDYRHNLLQANPPMGEKDFLEELYSDNKKKRYYYSHEEQLKLEDLPYDQELVTHPHTIF